ncbi:hypothetical protein NGM37_11695, partial [Streptomyces sp. TRM76130]|nr:hypothetical protein [Streptomyces sp. TRM76130]
AGGGRPFDQYAGSEGAAERINGAGGVGWGGAVFPVRRSTRAVEASAVSGVRSVRRHAPSGVTPAPASPPR